MNKNEQKRAIEIIPAILPQDYAEVLDKVDKVKGLVSTIQIDICDGYFVPSFSWPYKKHDDSFEKMLHEEIGLPDWQDLEYEFDLMVDKPEEKVENFVMIGASRIIIHAESKGDVVGAINSLQGKVEVGLALNIATPVSVIEPLKDKIQFIQCMGINRVGYQGQSFEPKVLDKIQEIRAKYPDLMISVDGAVSLDTASLLLDAGADRLVVGSAIFNDENPGEVISKLRELQMKFYRFALQN